MTQPTSKDIKHIAELEIFRGSKSVAHLRRTKQGCELELSDEFLEDSSFKHLTYTIGKNRKVIQHRGVNLPAFFAGLLPEGLRLKALVSELKTSEDDLFSILAATGEHTVGDIYTLAKPFERSPLKTLAVKEVDFYQLFEEDISKGFRTRGEEGLSGVQEKISASMISFPVNVAKKNKSYILKLNPKDKPNLTSNESQCLKLAKKCGLKVNNAKIVYDKNKNPGLLVERFDRVEKNGTPIKVHQEDACQFLNRYPADKYRLSFQEIAKGIEEIATAPKIELLKLLQLYVFSYLIGNGDLHAKNISLQTDLNTGRIQLTPAYDLICTYIYKDRKMALKLNGRDDEFKREAFLTWGENFGLTKSVVNNMIDDLVERLKKNQALLFSIANLSEKDRSLVEKMLKSRMEKLDQ